MRRLSVSIAFAAAMAANLGVAGLACAQAPDPAVAAARLKEQAAALAPLSRLDGEWRGEAWFMDRAGKKTTLVQTERVGSMLDGSVKMVEGRGFEGTEAVFNAFAVISYDPDKKTYSMRSYTRGYQGDFPIEVTADGFIWSMPAGPTGTLRYTAVVKDGTWVEKGEYVPNGGKGIQFMELTVKRVGDTRWPAEGGLGPK